MDGLHANRPCGSGGKVWTQIAAPDCHRVWEPPWRDGQYGESTDCRDRPTAKGAGVARRSGEGLAQLQFGSLSAPVHISTSWRSDATRRGYRRLRSAPHGMGSKGDSVRAQPFVLRAKKRPWLCSVGPKQIPRRPHLAALDVAHVDHRITDRCLLAIEPGIDDHVAQRLRTG